MYEDYTLQALPSREYRELIGTAICVFNSNNQFIIENILMIDNANYNWFELIDRISGKLSNPIKETVTRMSESRIGELFASIVKRRNRIVHSFQVSEGGNQVLRTKSENNDQFTITESYLMEFIKDNERLSSMLHELRGF